MSRMSGNDSVNRNVSSRVRKVARDGDNVTSSDRQFHTWGTATENVWLRTVEPLELLWTGAGRGSRCRKSQVLDDLEGRQRKWKTVQSDSCC